MKLYKIKVYAYNGSESHIWIRPNELDEWVRSKGATVPECYVSDYDEPGKVAIELEAHISELKKELKQNEDMLREVNDERNY